MTGNKTIICMCLCMLLLAGCKDSTETEESDPDGGTDLYEWFTDTGDIGTDRGASDTGSQTEQTTDTQLDNGKKGTSFDETPDSSQMKTDTESDLLETTSIPTDTHENTDGGVDIDGGTDTETDSDGGVPTDTGGLVTLDGGLEDGGPPCVSTIDFPEPEGDDPNGTWFVHLFEPPGQACDITELYPYDSADYYADQFFLFLEGLMQPWLDKTCIADCADMTGYEICREGACTTSLGAEVTYRYTETVEIVVTDFGEQFMLSIFEESTRVEPLEGSTDWSVLELIYKREVEGDADTVASWEDENYYTGYLYTDFDFAWEGKIDSLLPENGEGGASYFEYLDNDLMEDRDFDWDASSVSIGLDWSMDWGSRRLSVNGMSVSCDMMDCVFSE